MHRGASNDKINQNKEGCNQEGAMGGQSGANMLPHRRVRHGVGIINLGSPGFGKTPGFRGRSKSPSIIEQRVMCKICACPV